MSSPEIAAGNNAAVIPEKESPFTFATSCVAKEVRVFSVMPVRRLKVRHVTEQRVRRTPLVRMSQGLIYSHFVRPRSFLVKG